MSASSEVHGVVAVVAPGYDCSSMRPTFRLLILHKDLLTRTEFGERLGGAVVHLLSLLADAFPMLLDLRSLRARWLR